MATSSEVNRSWNETTCHQKSHEKFSFSCKREMVVRGKDWLGWSMCSNRPLQGYLEKVWISNFNFLCFFLRPYEILQLIWIFHHCSKSMKCIKIKLNTVELYKIYKNKALPSECNWLSRWGTARVVSSEMTKSTALLMERSKFSAMMLITAARTKSVWRLPVALNYCSITLNIK